MRISDWSSDVCSSDLASSCSAVSTDQPLNLRPTSPHSSRRTTKTPSPTNGPTPPTPSSPPSKARKRVVSGQLVPVRVDLAGRRHITQTHPPTPPPPPPTPHHTSTTAPPPPHPTP